MRRGLLLLGVAAVSIAASGKSHKIVRNTPALEFSYEWPAEAAAIPALDARLYAKGKALLAEAQKYAAEDRALARQQEREFHQHYYAGGWTTSGETPRLLSLEGGADEFTGGAHPNHSYEALLWDRRLNRPMPVAALFSRAADFAALTRAQYCKALDAERLKRREASASKANSPSARTIPSYRSPRLTRTRTGASRLSTLPPSPMWPAPMSTVNMKSCCR